MAALNFESTTAGQKGHGLMCPEGLGQDHCTQLGLLQVTNLFWDGEVSQKTNKREHRKKAAVLWQTLAGSGLPLSRKAVPLIITFNTNLCA